jgi:uncharacterized protein
MSNKNWFQTHSGRILNYQDPRLTDIDIHDVAVSLSRLCRFNGHSIFFYSVAQHSVLVSQLTPPEDALWGLLHDASEAFCGDMVSPLKKLVGQAYLDVEKAVMHAICDRFGLPRKQPVSVKAADLQALANEKRDLCRAEPAPWPTEMPDPLPDLRIEPWVPEYAARRFLERFVELTAGNHSILDR